MAESERKSNGGPYIGHPALGQRCNQPTDPRLRHRLDVIQIHGARTRHTIGGTQDDLSCPAVRSGTTGSRRDALVGPNLLFGPQVELATPDRLAAVPVGVAPLVLPGAQPFESGRKHTTDE